MVVVVMVVVVVGKGATGGSEKHYQGWGEVRVREEKRHGVMGRENGYMSFPLFSFSFFLSCFSDKFIIIHEKFSEIIPSMLENHVY